jgi:heme exporter protein D
MAYGRLLMVAGAAYVGVFITGVLGLVELAALVQLIAIFLLPLWAILSGIHMLRQRDARLVAARQ